MGDDAFLQTPNIKPLEEREKAAAEGEEPWTCQTCKKVWRRKQCYRYPVQPLILTCPDKYCLGTCLPVESPKTQMDDCADKT